jgi:hypothetical protein
VDRWAIFAATGAIVVCAAYGCGGDKFTAAPDGGDEAGATDGGADASVDATMMCILPPNGVGNEGPFCNFYAAQLSSCGHCEQCSQLDENQCVALGGTLSAAAKAAAVSCQSTLGCDDITTWANNSCVLQKLQNSPLTQGQQAAKMAFCTACPTKTAECNQFFDLTSDAGTAGLGSWVMLLSEPLVQQMITTCSGTSPKCDKFTYSVCAGLLFCGNGGAPHSNCTKGLCK